LIICLHAALPAQKTKGKDEKPQVIFGTVKSVAKVARPDVAAPPMADIVVEADVTHESVAAFWIGGQDEPYVHVGSRVALQLARKDRKLGRSREGYLAHTITSEDRFLFPFEALPLK
jgi:hypothetical protein